MLRSQVRIRLIGLVPLVLVAVSSPAWSQPVLGSVTPNRGPTAGGTGLLLRGSGFSGTSVSVQIGPRPCPVTTSDPTSIRCVLPEGEGAGQAVIVDVDGMVSDPLPFDYDRPFVSSVIPSTGPTSGGIPITIQGANFGVSTPAVTVGPNPCTDVTHSHTLILCTLPAGSGEDLGVRVIAAGQVSSPSGFFSYVAEVPATTWIGGLILVLLLAAALAAVIPRRQFSG